MTDYPSCPDCGAVSFGNLTCRTCRQHMRQETPALTEFLDRLDAANIETIPPVGAAEIRAFLAKLGGDS